MTSSQRIKKIIKLSNTTTCNYKYTEGDIWLAIPREIERFTTSDEFRKFDLKIFNHLLETSTTPTIPENEADIEDEFSDFDDTDADPDYQPKDLLPNGDENVENNIGIADHPTDNNETESRNDKEPKRPKKVIPKPLHWKANVRKEKRNSGQEYTTRKNKVVPRRKMKPPCEDKCRLHCNSKFTEIERQTIFEEFWAMGDIEKQRHYIIKATKTVTPKYRYVRADATCNRSNNQAFYLKCGVDSENIRVCKYFFMATLDITIRMIRTTLDKQSETGAIDSDHRGRKVGKGVLEDSLTQSVKDHINSIPRIESHYLRAQSTREFIEGGKTLTQLYRDYKALSEANNKSFVKESMYRYIFNTQFNISFFTPKKDQCEECESNKNNDNEQYDNTSFLKHLEEKHLAREEKEVDKKRSSIELICAVYDLQAVLTVPRGDVSVFYYISKVANYNFTVCEIQSMEAFCYLWHEGEAHRGPNEIASCLFKFIQKKSEERTNDFEIIFYSDNCGGQNKNKFIIGLYQYALKVFPNLKTITHKFLIRGHTQNEGDSVHSVIEKQIKLSLKSSPIYTAYQYAQIIRDSKKKAPFFKVEELDHSNFFNFKDYTSRIGNNFNINTNSESIHFNDIKVLKLSRGQTDTHLNTKHPTKKRRLR
ncbi:hypothetical protein QTP88_029054 [Uroleucon formosanum]